MQAIPGAWVCDPAGPGLLPQPTHPPQPRYPIAYIIYLIHTQETEHTAQYRQGGVIQNFLAIFENEHYAAYQVYFYKSNSRKSTIFATHARQSFHFQKSQTFKIIFFGIFSNTIILLQRTNAKKKFGIYFGLIFCRPPK